MIKKYIYIRAVDVDEFDKRLSDKLSNPQLRKSMMMLDDRYFDSLDIPSPFPFHDGFDSELQKSEFIKRHNVQIKAESGFPIYDGEKLVEILMTALQISRGTALEYVAIRKKYFYDEGLMGNLDSRVYKPERF